MASTTAIERASGCRSGENSTYEASAICSRPSQDWVATRTASNRRNSWCRQSRRRLVRKVTSVPVVAACSVTRRVLLQVGPHLVVLEGRGQLGHLRRVDDVDALPVLGAEAGNRGLQQLDVLAGEPQRECGRADLVVAEAVVHGQVLGQVADEGGELRWVGHHARAEP